MTPRRRLLIVSACILAALGLFLAYLRMARAVTVNSDGASNALQAWDLFHGNPLLRGWTLSDVSFYPTELIQYGLVQLVIGVTTDQIHVTAALTWLLVVALAAWLAYSVPPGRRWVGAAVAVAILLVPAPGLGYQTLLSSPNHTGSAVPLLLAWLLVALAGDRAWMPYVVAAVLAWGAMGDPMITFVGAVPLIVVAAWRALRARDFRGVDARLAVAGVASVVLSHVTLWLIEGLGGFRAPRPPIELSPVSQWPDRAGTVGRMAGVLFGTSRPAVQSRWVEATLQVVHAPGLVLAAVALLLTAVAVVCGTADRVDAILAVAVVCDVAAEIVSTLPIDLLATREIAPVLPMAAVLAGRTATRWLFPPDSAPSAADQELHDVSAGDARADRALPDPPAAIAPGENVASASSRVPDPATAPQSAAASAAEPKSDPKPAGSGTGRSAPSGPPRFVRGAQVLLAAVLAVQLVSLVAYAPPRAEPVEGQEAADWLQQQGLRYGLGSYWVSNNITVGTSRKVTVVPTLSGPGKLVGMCWQTHEDMYDASKHDARFVLLEKQRPMYGTAADVLAQYGPPVTRRDFPLYAIFVYDHNLLEGFTTTC
ncbi:hypothetical protein [Dactylosporangium sp. CA-139066]|uniref:hypothetical protein n=1 Tax=Dactylosporangium sp. CA-139066 TaxID=3239930 RepID=UPI003D91C8AD